MAFVYRMNERNDGLYLGRNRKPTDPQKSEYQLLYKMRYMEDCDREDAMHVIGRLKSWLSSYGDDRADRGLYVILSKNLLNDGKVHVPVLESVYVSQNLTESTKEFERCMAISKALMSGGLSDDVIWPIDDKWKALECKRRRGNAIKCETIAIPNGLNLDEKEALETVLEVMAQYLRDHCVGGVTLK